MFLNTARSFRSSQLYPNVNWTDRNESVDQFFFFILLETWDTFREALNEAVTLVKMKVQEKVDSLQITDTELHKLLREVTLVFVSYIFPEASNSILANLTNQRNGSATTTVVSSAAAAGNGIALFDKPRQRQIDFPAPSLAPTTPVAPLREITIPAFSFPASTPPG